ncbi:MAG: hypothetical protein VB996_14460, partial [Pseudomonadales bacterium]
MMHVDLAGCNILAAANNHVVSAAGQEEISLVIQVTRIRCWKPAILIMNPGCEDGSGFPTEPSLAFTGSLSWSSADRWSSGSRRAMPGKMQPLASRQISSNDARGVS